MLDLFSGLGGASEAFIRDPSWSVLRIENNPLLAGVPNTVMDDVKRLAKEIPTSFTWGTQKIDLIWASPPCAAFSGGYNSPKSIASREIGLDNYKPDMSLMLAALEIVEKVKPKYFVIENVVGAVRYFEEYLGMPSLQIGPYVLWGSFPPIDCNFKPKKKQNISGSQDPLRANKRALIPIEISQALKFAIENQKSILDY